MKINDIYNGWKVLSVTEIPQYKSECIWTVTQDNVSEEPYSFSSFQHYEAPGAQ